MSGAAPRRLYRKDLEAFYPVPGSLPRTLMPLPEHRVIYVKNPLVGSSTLTRLLNQIYTGRDDLAAFGVHSDHQLPRAGELGWPRVCRMLEGEAFRFSFVRNPVDRAQSCWRKKVVLTKRYRPQLWAALGKQDRGEDPLTFEEFLSALEASDPLATDRHWRAQHVNLMHPLIDYDFVGRLESFDDDLRTLSERAGLPEMRPKVSADSATMLTRANRSKKGTVTFDGSSVYDGRPDLLRRVEAHYAQDMEIYGY